MKKALIVSTVSRQFTLFETGNIEILNDLGYEVHCAANYSDATEKLDELNIVKHHIDIERSPFNINQIKAYTQLSKLMKEEKFDLVHCHAPMGGVIGRLVAKKNNIANILYTAHGFHFYKGAPKINNIFYKNIEKILAKYTTKLITINNEDFENARKFSGCGDVYKINGVGIDSKNYKLNFDFDLRKHLNIKKKEFIIVSIGELNKNKNHEIVLKALSNLNIDFKYCICGQGECENYLKELALNLGILENVKFLGYRNDVIDILYQSDLFIISSIREGLSKATMEAMALGKIIIASRIRGNIDLIEENVNGYLFDPNNSDELLSKINKVVYQNNSLEKIKSNNLEKSKKYSIEFVNKQMRNIYKEL